MAVAQVTEDYTRLGLRYFPLVYGSETIALNIGSEL